MFRFDHRPLRPHALWFWLAAPVLIFFWSELPSEHARVLRPSPALDPAAAALLFGERLDPNAATSRDLQLLPTIGPARAEAIVEHAKVRPFRRLRDLEGVRGIGPKTVEKIAEWLDIQSVVADPTPSAQAPPRTAEAAGRAAAREQGREQHAYGCRGR